MMKSRFVPLFILLIGLSFSACTGCNSNHSKDNATKFEKSLAAKDTTEVEQVVAQFFDHIGNKQYYDAAAMLYTRTDTAQVPRQYSNDEMDRFVKVYKSLPYEGYRIDYMKFFSANFNEVVCSFILQKGQNGQPDAETKIFFSPVMLDGKWCLILTDSRNFEEPVTNYQQRDSLKERYDNYKKTHK